MRDNSARNFGVMGIMIILIALATLMLFGVLTYLAWNEENPWQPPKTGELAPPARLMISGGPHYVYTVLRERSDEQPPIPTATRMANHN